MSRVHLCSVMLPLLFGSMVALADDAAPDYAFQADAIDGGSVSVSAHEDAPLTVVCFLGSECPLARLYASRLQALSEQYAKRVRFVGVASNRQDSVADLQQFAARYKLTIPIVKDHRNRIADRYDAERTPEVFLLDASLTLRYRGRIDDELSPGVTRPEASREDLRIAIEEVLGGEAVSVPRTAAVGCLIGRVSKTETEVTTEITYTKEVARILQRHCVECHREGEIGPFALTDYEEIPGWGPMIMEVIDDGRMPPWHADPKTGRFLNARSMPTADIETLREWVSGGMPFGEASDLPKLPTAKTGWQITVGTDAETPDLVLPMRSRPYTVPAEGIVEYQYFVVDPKFEEDRWIAGAEVLPGNRSVVHHAIVFIRAPDGENVGGIGWLTAYVPGQRAMRFPEGYARRVPAGSKLIFQMHYTPTGSPQDDLTKLGIVFADEKTVTREVRTLVALNNDFEIPPRAENFPVEASRGRLPKGGELLAVAPHMHVRGKSFDLFADRKGSAEHLLSVPRYDFNWQHVYALETPLPLGNVDRLRFVARFDNSSGNPVNPDPEAFVEWGDQTWEEMAIGFFEIAVPRTKPRDDEKKAMAKPRRNAQPKTKRSPEAQRFASDYLKRFDRNGDGGVQAEELPEAIRRFGFWRLDRDRNGTVSRDELETAYERRVK